jgi:hypothetical protein
MKKLLLLLAVTMAFTFTALAQTDTSQAGSQTTTTTKTKTKKSKAADTSGGAAATDQGAKGAKAKKEASVTGCLSAQPDSNGNYTLSNGRYKNGVEVGPTDKVKDHAGHQVQLKGEWKAAGGETAGGGTKAAAKSFEVASVKHLADTCSAAAGGGTTGATKKGEKDMKKGKAKGATPPGF